MITSRWLLEILFPVLTLPKNHAIPSARYLDKILYKIFDKPPENYKQLLELEGVGPSTLRALAMASEITHGAQPSLQDPFRYAFAHDGKDNHPFPFLKKFEIIIRITPVIIEGIEKEDNILGPSAIQPNESLNAIPKTKSRKPNQKITLPNGECFFIDFIPPSGH